MAEHLLDVMCGLADLIHSLNGKGDEAPQVCLSRLIALLTRWLRELEESCSGPGCCL